MLFFDNEGTPDKLQTCQDTKKIRNYCTKHFEMYSQSNISFFNMLHTCVLGREAEHQKTPYIQNPLIVQDYSLRSHFQCKQVSAFRAPYLPTALLNFISPYHVSALQRRYVICQLLAPLLDIGLTFQISNLLPRRWP